MTQKTQIWTLYSSLDLGLNLSNVRGQTPVPSNWVIFFVFRSVRVPASVFPLRMGNQNEVFGSLFQVVGAITGTA